MRKPENHPKEPLTGQPYPRMAPTFGLEFYWQPTDDNGPTEADMQHNLEAAQAGSIRFQEAFATAASMTEKFDVVRTFVGERHFQIIDAHADSIGHDYAGAHVAFTTYKTAYDQTDSLYTKRVLEWGMFQEIHEIAGELGNELLYIAKPDINWLDWYYDGEKAGHVEVELTDTAVKILAEHPEYQEMFDYGAKLAAEKPHLGESDYYAPSPYGSLHSELREAGIKNSHLEGVIGAKNYELAIETSSLFSVAMDDLSEAARRRLVEYGLSLDESTYARLKSAGQRLARRESRIQFAEAFLATEFGDDLGEQILTLAEHGQGDNKVPDQLRQVGNILRSVRAFTTEGILHEVDTNLADDIRRGISTRTSEILYALNQRLDKGKPTEKIEIALAKLEEYASGVAEMLQDGIPQKVQEAGDTKLYHFINPETGQKYPGAVELTTNGKFAEEATARERYIKEGRGARGSFTYDEEQPHLALSLNGTVRRGAMNGRFDKSVYNIITDESEPDAEHAEVSFDLASVHGSKNSKSRMTAEAITEGSAIRDTGHGNKGGAKNFTYDIIGQSWGQRDKFAGAIREFGDILDSREREHRGKKLAGQAVKHAHTILKSAA